MRARVFAFALLVSSGAHANGRYAGAYQIVAAPNNPDVLLTRTTFGLLLSTDRGANWDWICEGAIGYGADAAQEDPTLAITGDGSILAGLQAGLAVSSSNRCNWSFKLNVPVIDVTIAKSSPSTAVAIASQLADAGTYTTQLHRSIDDGKTFTPWGVPINPQFFPITVDVAPSDPQTVYVTARVAPGNISLFASTNGAASWAQRPISVTMTERDAFIAAVDPMKSDRVYVRTYDALSGGARLLVTDDAGLSWKERFVSADAPLNGFALSTDGSKVWIADDTDGLLSADTTAFAFTKLNPIQPKCLGAFGTRVYACTDVKQEFLAVSDNGGKDFTQLLPFCGLRGPLTCATSCAAGWPDLKSGLGYPCPDAGVPSDASVPSDGSTSDAGTTPPPPKDGCGCQSSPSGSLSALGIVAALAMLLRRFRARYR